MNENGVTECNACTVYSKHGLISLRHGHASLKRVLLISGINTCRRKWWQVYLCDHYIKKEKIKEYIYIYINRLK
jgi:hypothetical protein